MHSFLFTICTVSQLCWNRVCIYIYIYIYVYMCVCVCVCVCFILYIYIYIYIFFFFFFFFVNAIMAITYMEILKIWIDWKIPGNKYQICKNKLCGKMQCNENAFKWTQLKYSSELKPEDRLKRVTVLWMRLTHLLFLLKEVESVQSNLLDTSDNSLSLWV